MRGLPMILLAMTALGSQPALASEDEFERGREEFLNSCASCHGEDGKGAGFLTRVFRGVDPGDLTQLAARHHTGQFPLLDVFQIVDGRAVVPAHGDRKMPVWGDRYRVEAGETYGPYGYGAEPVIRGRILELVFYLQSIQEPAQ